MKALSVMEPWATLICRYGKTTENRSWQILHRGPLLICASRRIEPGWDQQEWDALLHYLGPLGTKLPRRLASLLSEFRLGHAIGLVDVVACDRQTSSPWDAEGQWHARLQNARPLKRPFPIRGQLGIFDLPCDPANLETE